MPELSFYYDALLSDGRAWAEKELATLRRIVERDRALSEGERARVLERLMREDRAAATPPRPSRKPLRPDEDRGRL